MLYLKICLFPYESAYSLISLEEAQLHISITSEVLLSGSTQALEFCLPGDPPGACDYFILLSYIFKLPVGLSVDHQHRQNSKMSEILKTWHFHDHSCKWTAVQKCTFEHLCHCFLNNCRSTRLDTGSQQWNPWKPQPSFKEGQLYADTSQGRKPSFDMPFHTTENLCR